MKLLLLILDGLGDRPCNDLGGLTPLQSAVVPHLDSLAEEGMCGLLDTVGLGVCPGSDTSHLSLFGYDPYEVYTGRGPFEAIGVGAEVRGGDVAFRCNFATYSDGEIIDRRAGRIKVGTQELAATIDGWEVDGVKVILVAATEHRAALVLRGEGLDHRISDVDPHHDGPPLEARPLVPEAERTAAVLNKVVKEAHLRMDAHEVNQRRAQSGKPVANYLLPRGPGMAPTIPPIMEKWGFESAAAVAGVGLVKGACRFVGFDLVEVEGATGGTDTDHLKKMEAVLKALKTNDLVVCNVKAPDIFGHDSDAVGKRDWLQEFDHSFGVLKAGLEDTIVAVTGDHSTPCDSGNHTSDPVPLLVWGPGQRSDLGAAFNERDCSGGSLNGMKGPDLMPFMLGLAERTEKYGA